MYFTIHVGDRCTDKLYANERLVHFKQCNIFDSDIALMK